MKLKHKNANNKRLIIPVTLIIFLVLAAGLLFWKRHNDQQKANKTNIQAIINNSDINYGPPSEQEVQDAESQKIQKIENPKTQPTQDERVVIANIYQDLNNRNLVVITELHGSDWSSCTLTLKYGSSVVTKSANVIFQQTYSSCAGFSIPIGDFGSEGSWTAQLTGKKTNGSSVISEPEAIDIKK